MKPESPLQSTFRFFLPESLRFRAALCQKETLHVFLEIVRAKQSDDSKYNYGAIFVGMSEMDSKRIETYDTIANMENNEQL